MPLHSFSCRRLHSCKEKVDMNKPISLYIHIPFCVKRCGYCDFLTFAHADKYHESYKNALVREIRSASKLKKYNIKTIFIGGGTPTILSPSFIAEIFFALSIYNIDKNCEITVEANPGTLSLETLRTLKNNGVNRLSIGLQAWQNNVLKKIDRNHTREEFLTNYKNARRLGFKNINIDMIFSLPYMKNKEEAFSFWMKGLHEVTRLKPEHMSLYSLIIEEKTLFYHKYSQGLLVPQTQELDRRMYHFAINYLAKKGYTHYEISNFSKPRKECEHNKVYWQGGEYMAFGLGAAGFIDNVRYSNERDLLKYINTLQQVGYKHGNIISEKTEVDKIEAMGEFFYLGLRCTNGVLLWDFEEKFGVSAKVIFGDVIDKNIKNGLLIEEKNSIKLTKKGLDISNQVFSDFI